MKKQMVTLLLLCLSMQPLSWAASAKKTLFYTIHNAQEHNVVLRCNAFHLTGEKITSFTRDIMPGRTQPLPMHNLNRNCKGGVIVKCKLKQKSDDYGIEYFGMTMPCEHIENGRCLELSVSKESKLSGHYSSL